MNPDRTDLPVETVPRLCMVGWYDPAQLFRTGIQVIVSTLFGRHSDARRLDTLSSKPPIIDYRDEKCRSSNSSPMSSRWGPLVRLHKHSRLDFALTPLRALRRTSPGPTPRTRLNARRNAVSV